MRFLRRHSGLVLSLVLGLLASPAAAQLTHVRELSLPDDHLFLIPLSGRPTYTGYTAPGHELTGHFLFGSNGTQLYALDYAAGRYAIRYELPANTIPGSLAAWASDGSAELFVTSQFFTQYAFNLTNGGFATWAMDFVYASGNNTLLAQGQNLFVMTSHSIVNSVVGPRLWRLDAMAHGTEVLSTAGTAPGQLGSVGSAALGPDGLLYLLDQANGTNRIQRFDLSEGLAEVDRFRGAFDVPFTLDSLYAGMAISPDGRIYLGDGSGGLIAYDLEGGLLGTIRFAGEGSPDTNGLNGVTGKSILGLDGYGNIFVYTPETGMHQYFDAGAGGGAAIPEPSTYAALAGLAAVALAAARRRR